MRGVCACLLFTTAVVYGQVQNQPREEHNRPFYKLFAAIEPEQIEKRLNKYAAEGYRLSAIAGGGEDTTLVIMSAILPEALTFKYKVIRSSLLTLNPRLKPKETSILDLMNAAGAEGYRLVTDSVVEYVPPLMPNYAQDFKHNYVPRGFSVIMERKSDESGRYEYFIFAPWQLSKPSFEDLTENYQKAQQDGFSTVYFGGETVFPYVLISQRDVTQQSPERTEVPKDHFSVVQFKELIPQIQKEAEAGYAVRVSTVFRKEPGQLNPGAGPITLNLWSQKASDGPLKLVLFDGKIPYDFESFRSFMSEFQSKLNSSADGLCVAGVIVGFAQVPTFFHSNNVATMGIATKPCPAGGKVVFRYALGATAPDLAENINQLATEGYSLVPGAFDTSSALMEKVN